MFKKEEIASLKETINSKAKEQQVLKEKLLTVEKELESVAYNQNRKHNQRFSPHNYLKSSPESSVGDKSESDLSKKFNTKNNLFLERETGNDGGNYSRSIPNSRYRHVI